MSFVRRLTGFFERNTYHRLMKYRVSEQFVKDETRRAKEEGADAEIRAAHLILRKSWQLTRSLAHDFALRPADESALIRETAALIGALIPVDGLKGVPLKAAVVATLRAESWASSDITGGEKTTDRTTAEYRQAFLAGQEKKAFAKFASRAKAALRDEGLTAEEAEDLVLGAILNEASLETAAHAAAQALGKKA